MDIYQENILSGPYKYSSDDAGRRSLKNICLGYLMVPDATGNVPEDQLNLALTQYRDADNMTDKVTALKAVVNCDRTMGDELLADYYELWKEDPLVVDKWLTLQALCTLPGTLKRVEKLTAHPSFVLKNPNKVRSLIGAFCGANQVRFHDLSGKGYAFLADYVIRLNGMNPQIASRLLTPLTTWKRYDTARQSMMRGELERIMGIENLSGDVDEVVSKSL